MYAVFCRQPAARGCGERDSGADPKLAQPILAGVGRAGLTAPHRKRPLYSQLHLPAMTRTLKEEENSLRSRSRKGAPFNVSEVISHSSADVGSALCCCRRCDCALVFARLVCYILVCGPASLSFWESVFVGESATFLQGRFLFMPRAFSRTLCSPVSAFQVVLRT